MSCTNNLKFMCPRGEIGRHKGLKKYRVLQLGK